MPQLDVTKLKVAIDRLLEVNPIRTLIGISATSVVLLATMWGQSAQNSAVPLSDTDIQLLRRTCGLMLTRSLPTQCNSPSQNLRPFGRCTETMHATSS